MTAAAPARMAVALALAGCAGAHAQSLPGDLNLRQRAGAVVALVGYSTVPDVTTGSLGIHDASAANPDLRISSMGGGFTWNPSPLYLEGTLAVNRYDPSFATTAAPGATLPVRWDSRSATGGIGWDFALATDLRLRPILNATVGRLESDAPAANAFSAPDAQMRFLKAGRLNLAGAGGSLMLDYERYRSDGELDAELRYSDIFLRSRGDTSEAVRGSARASSLGLWTRWRAPTGLVAMERPVRSVLEYAVTRFLGDLDGALGFKVLNSFGAGLEVDTGARDIFVTRARVVARYVAGNHVNGWSLGIAASF